VIPTGPGTYALLLSCSASRCVRIGSLGSRCFQRGWYVYVGSAFGPGGLRARISHHQRLARRPHWHIDYLRRHSRLVGAYYVAGVRCEHEWAEALRNAPGAEIPVGRFGSSDCNCEAHLFRFAESPVALIKILASQ